MKRNLAIAFSLFALALPIGTAALVTCRDTDKGCSLEQNLQLIKDANAMGLSRVELIDILQEAVQQLSDQLALLSSGGRTINCVDLQSDLWIGKTDATTGGEVSKLQRFLLNQGYGDSASDFRNPTGYYGDLTAGMVVKWQKAHGMDFVTKTSGVGPMTRAKMKCGSTGALPITKVVWRIEPANPSATGSYQKDEQAIFVDVVRSDSSIRGYSVGKAYGCAASSNVPVLPGKRVLGFVNCYYALTGVGFTAYEANGKFIVERGDESARDGSVKKTIVLEI